jgi:hypothetical protein
MQEETPRGLSNKYVFLICLIISIALWLMVRSKELVHLWEAPIYVQWILPQGYGFEGKEPRFLVKGSEEKSLGWNNKENNLLKTGLSAEHPIVVDIRDSMLYRNTGDKKLISSAMLETLIRNQITSDWIVKYNSKKREQISLVQKSRKVVPVVLKNAPQFKNGFGLGDEMKLFPDTIMIEGPSKLLKNINEWALDLKLPNDLKTSKRISISSKNVPGFVIYSRRNNLRIDSFLVQIPVSELTEFKIELPLGVSNMEPLSFPKSVMLHGKIPISKYESIREENFTVEKVVNANRKSGYFPLVITKKPPLSSDIFINPEMVFISN